MLAFSSSAGNGSTCAVWIWLASICMWWKEAPQSQQQNGFLAAGICLLYSAAKAGLNSILSQVGRCPMMTIIEFMTCFHEFSKFFHQYYWSKKATFLRFEKIKANTGKSLSEALILGSTNPQYDKRLLIDLPVQYMKTTSSEHGENMLCTQIVFLLLFWHSEQFMHTTCSPHVLSL